MSEEEVNEEEVEKEEETEDGSEEDAGEEELSETEKLHRQIKEREKRLDRLEQQNEAYRDLLEKGTAASPERDPEPEQQEQGPTPDEKLSETRSELNDLKSEYKDLRREKIEAEQEGDYDKVHELGRDLIDLEDRVDEKKEEVFDLRLEKRDFEKQQRQRETAIQEVRRKEAGEVLKMYKDKYPEIISEEMQPVLDKVERKIVDEARNTNRHPELDLNSSMTPQERQKQYSVFVDKVAEGVKDHPFYKKIQQLSPDSDEEPEDVPSLESSSVDSGKAEDSGISEEAEEAGFPEDVINKYD